MSQTVPTFTGSGIQEYTRAELYERARTLELEYFGGAPQLDENNIGDLVQGTQKFKAQRFATFRNIVKPLISAENVNYNVPANRIPLSKTGGQVASRITNHIAEQYEKAQFDQFMQKFEHMAALQGTVLAGWAYDDESEQMRLIELYPSNASLKIKGSNKFPGVPVEVSYSYEVNDITYWITWTKDLLITKWKDITGEHRTEEEHGYGRLPFAVLKYAPDNTRTFGFPDEELYSFCKHRSLILANTMTRLHLSDLEKLLVMGVDLDTAIKNIKDKILALPADLANPGVRPDAKFISPDGQDALNLLEAYARMWKDLKETRGHVNKPFSNSAAPIAYDTMQVASQDLKNEQNRKRKFLERFDQELFELFKIVNNAHMDTQVPEGTQIRIQFEPDPYSFSSAKDEVEYFTSAIKARVETPIGWIKFRNSEFTDDEAKDYYEANKKFFEEEQDSAGPSSNNIMNEQHPESANDQDQAAEETN